MDRIGSNTPPSSPRTQATGSLVGSNPVVGTSSRNVGQADDSLVVRIQRMGYGNIKNATEEAKNPNTHREVLEGMFNKIKECITQNNNRKFSISELWLIDAIHGNPAIQDKHTELTALMKKHIEAVGGYR